MQLDIVIGEKEDGVFYFFHFSSLSLCLSSPPDKPQYAISFRAMRYYTWIRIIKRAEQQKQDQKKQTKQEGSEKARYSTLPLLFCTRYR